MDKSGISKSSKRFGWASGGTCLSSSESAASNAATLDAAPADVLLSDEDGDESPSSASL